jgi:hypothetical protein
MRGMEMKSLWGGVAASALLFTYGCGAAQNAAGVRAEAASTQAGSPVVVSCEPNQRTLVRPVIVNGATVSQIECVSVDGQAAAYAQPTAMTPQALPAGFSYASQPVYQDLAPARVVPIRTQTVPVSTQTVARPVRTRQVVYDEPVRTKRSVKKSAVIIGSSAAIGAGVGAVTGGKKGALIGAAIGGGGAAVWDQITRRR